MAARRKAVKHISTVPTKKPISRNRKQDTGIVSDFFRLGESYTSLVLGIIVVIAAAALLVTLAKSRVTAPAKSDTATSSTSTAQLPSATPIPLTQVVTPQTSPTKTLAQNASTPTSFISPTPTTQPTRAVTTPTLQPTRTTATPTVVQTTPNATPVPQVTPGATQGTRSYTVKAGDDLWNIAVRAYGDGYQWSAIAKANNISNPDVILAGSTITLPERSEQDSSRTLAQASVTPSPVLSQPRTTGPPTGSIAGTSYTVQRGDDLWNIAVRAYGNGYKWVEIARANHLSMPGVIHHGNILTIPR